MPSHPLHRRLLPAAAIAIAFAATACGPGPERRDVVLLTLDTTRADRLGIYGRPDARTPFLDRLGRQGAVVEDALCDVPVTLPSHTTMMTGVPALGHGVRYNADFKVTDDARTLAEALRDGGWDTAAFVSALVLDRRFGLDQGFRVFDDSLTPGYVKHDESIYPKETHWLPKADRRADATVDAALRWLGGARSPFLLWVHVYDPHFPFDPPPPWSRTASERYLAEIQWTDRQIGRLLRALEARDAADPVVLATADHGEGLDQHREDGHGIFVYDDTMRIPFLLRAPHAVPAGVVRPGPARTMDYAPTLLALAGRPGPFGLGGNLVPGLRGDGALPDTVAYLESIKTKLFYGGTGLKALRSRDAKFVWAPAPELYDLRVDPGETRNLAASRPGEVDAWRAALDGAVKDILAEDLASVEAYHADPTTLEELRALGYLGGSGAAAGPLPFEEEMRLAGNDPKDLVDVSMGAREIQNGFLENGEAKLLRFLRTARPAASDPAMARLHAAAHLNLAKVSMARRDWAGAAERYRLSLVADPSYEPARWSRVYALNLAGRPAEAAAEAEAFLREGAPSDRVMLHAGLARALLGQTDEARALLRRVASEGEAGQFPSESAAWYLERLGGPREKAALTAYLERNASAASSGESDGA